ncbi:DM7 family protein GG17593 isoform X1 [Drosophila biarmipes]|uniref:DM7 family protein GG17593 isoform X1 n=1 Tax=Drosophila biarmipes TaxID=125945 RepID=UPI0007E6E531|nr:DM7 family protein GG17593 isoform X1 [Drosophila biarmipes]
MKRRGNNKGKSGLGVLELHQVKRLDLSDQVVIVKRPKYMPNLHNLVMPLICYEHDNRVVAARLSIEVHKHDQDAANFFEGAEAPCLNIPRTLFPNRAPVDKIIFMPRLLLPVGFDAGGVFGPGVIPKRFYPLGLMPPNHKGATPPLFVGLRTKDFQMPVEVQKLLESVPPVITTGLPATPPKVETKIDLGYTPNYRPPPAPTARGRDRLPEGPSLEMRMLRHDITLSMVYTTPTAPKPASTYPFRHLPVQYNIYTPDLSNVLMIMPRVSKLTVAILSTIVHPHEPAVAMATMGDEVCPDFELPAEVFPACEGVKRPIFLPERFQPKGFKAGCIFKPGSLPESFFRGGLWKAGTPQPQHSNGITPPLFVGQFTSARAASAFLKSIQAEGRQKADEAAAEPAGSGAGYVQSVEFSTRKLRCLTKGFLMLETEDPATPPGAHSLKNYLHAYTAGCFVRVTQEQEQEHEELRCCSTCMDPRCMMNGTRSPESTDLEEYYGEEMGGAPGATMKRSDTPDPRALPEVEPDNTESLEAGYVINRPGTPFPSGTYPESFGGENGMESPAGYIISRPGTPYPGDWPGPEESFEKAKSGDPTAGSTMNRTGVPYPSDSPLDDTLYPGREPQENRKKEPKPMESLAAAVMNRPGTPFPSGTYPEMSFGEKSGMQSPVGYIISRPGTPYPGDLPGPEDDPLYPGEGPQENRKKEPKPIESLAVPILNRPGTPFPSDLQNIQDPEEAFKRENGKKPYGAPYLDVNTNPGAEPKESLEGGKGKGMKPTEPTAGSTKNRSETPDLSDLSDIQLDDIYGGMEPEEFFEWESRKEGKEPTEATGLNETESLASTVEFQLNMTYSTGKETESEMEVYPDAPLDTSLGSLGSLGSLDDEKYLKYFKIDSDIDLIADAVADFGKAEMKLMFCEEAMSEDHVGQALDQLRQVLEERDEIRDHTDQLYLEHAQRMEDDCRRALRKVTRCKDCGKFHLG